MAIKLGTENKTKTYAAIGLMCIALIFAVKFIYQQFFADPTPPSVSIPAPARTSEPAKTNVRTGAKAAPSMHQAIALPSASTLDPTLHPEVMAQAEATTYTGDGRNIFSPNSAPAAPVNIEKVHGPIRPVAQVPTGPPPPPNIDLKFYGYSVRAGQRRIFLLRGESLFDAAEGDTVDRRYKIVKINPFSVEVEDLGYNHTQTLPLTQN